MKLPWTAIPLLAVVSTAAPASELAAVKIYTEEAGVHRVDFEDLEAAGLDTAGINSALPALSTGGRMVPLRMVDGGDGHFADGDYFEFVAENLRGESTHHHPYSPLNVYWLEWDSERARRLPDGRMTAADGDDPIAEPERRLHYERDQLLIRLAAKDIEPREEPDLWYWSKLTHRSKERFRLEVDARGAKPLAKWSVAANFRGMSTGSDAFEDIEGLWDHRVEVFVDGSLVGKTQWNGRGTQATKRNHVRSPEAPPAAAVVEISVDPQKSEGERLIDVVMVDWLKVEFPIEPKLLHRHVQWWIAPGQENWTLPVRSDAAKVGVFGSSYWEWNPADEKTAALRLERDSSLWLRAGDFALDPVAIDVDAPSNLRDFGRQADYLILSHGALVEASEELAALHRGRGLTVEVIDVQDVYDEFGYGIVSPGAIREFVAHAFHNWRAPAPRFVLLVGDASWDTKNSTVDDANYANWGSRESWRGERFGKMETEDYEEALLNNRNLIPSWNFHTSEGHAASDAYFAMVAGNDELPDLALGRLPVIEPAEVRAITEKVRRYIQDAPLGPWRGRHLWITGGVSSHKSRSRKLAAEFALEGHHPQLILPGDAATVDDRGRILTALNEGTLLTHFIGHGGRFIWRTAPPDLSDQIDLFGLAELEELEPSERLPVVVSVACYSAPFDHPSADSIGEAFLRLPDRGAIGFIGASWRNAPPRALSELLVEALSRPGTVGEALLYAKRTLARPDPVHLYNLLGDPAVPVAAPQSSVELHVESSEEQLQLRADLPEEAVGGRVALVFLDEESATIASDEVAIESSEWTYARPREERISRATLYFWNEGTGVDGHGATTIASPGDTQRPSP